MKIDYYFNKDGQDIFLFSCEEGSPMDIYLREKATKLRQEQTRRVLKGKTLLNPATSKDILSILFTKT